MSSLGWMRPLTLGNSSQLARSSFGVGNAARTAAIAQPVLLVVVLGRTLPLDAPEAGHHRVLNFDSLAGLARLNRFASVRP